MWLRDTGLLDRWGNSFLPPPYRCSAPLYSTRPQKNEKLSLHHLSSAFLLYGVGIVASIVAFVFECLFSGGCLAQLVNYLADRVNMAARNSRWLK